MKTLGELSSRWLRRKPESLSASEVRVLQSALERQLLVNEKDSGDSIGGRVADSLMRVGGSWGFIVGSLVFLAIWTSANAWLLGRATFDPYPFVFLNLVLSMLAALQAPVIMMSQNRQAEHDRLAAARDYEVNLKAEIEIMALHEKLDEMHAKELSAIRAELVALREAVARLSPAAIQS